MKVSLSEELVIAQGVTAVMQHHVLTIKGPKGELSREFKYPGVVMKIDNGKLLLSAVNASKREKARLYTFLAHAKNMMQGVQQEYVYTLKIKASHFPMNVSFANSALTVKNFLGEKVPRVMSLDPTVKVVVAGDTITVSSPDKERAGKTASQIELGTRLTFHDLRVFQDGIYIVEKVSS